ncbi:MAG: hypothetical protein U1A07_20495 [Phenylobacterium sp.]|nr:hypothetical protein [Phenylobacterium sp.]
MTGNTSAIRSAIRRASATIETEGRVRVELLDSPRGSGAREIAVDLAEHIRECDVFIADVSIVQRSPEGRAFPNPNVVFELGLAAARVGWDRIVLLSNDEFGRPEDQPFDYRGRTIRRYRIRQPHAAGDRRQLELSIERELRSVLEDDPPRPRELETGTEEAIRRSRDVEQLHRYLACINRGVIDEHLERGPDQRLAHVVLLFDRAHEVANSSAFRLSDHEAEAAVRALDEAWARTLDHDEHFRETSNLRLQIFGSRNPIPEERRREGEAAEALRQAYGELSVAWRRLLEILHARYVEIDLNATDRSAGRQLQEMFSEAEDDAE